MIKTFDYLGTLASLEHEILDALKGVLNSGYLILGPETEAFEHEFAGFVGAKHCIGVSSGTTALQLALMGLGIGHGDEVITVSNTCVPTIAAIELSGATPVFVDVRHEDLMIDSSRVGDAVTDQTKCILPIHLWGQSVDIEAVMAVAQQEGLYVVEDCAQAHGTLYGQQHVGTFGNAGCFSFYPTKNLGAYGDAGAIVTNDEELADRLLRLRMYGYDNHNCSVEKGMNARISEMQSAILRIKLRRLPQWLNRRKEISALYDAKIDKPGIEIPFQHAGRNHSFHQYVIRCRERDRVANALRRHDIASGIHYPVPVHCMPAYAKLKRLLRPLPITERASEEILSLPIHEALTNAESEKVASVIKGA